MTGRLRSLIATLLLAVGVLTPTAAQAAPLAAGSAVAAMQPGWNLGNTFDATGADETSWGNPRVTPELLAGIRAQGFRSIRIPVTWSQHLGPAPDYTIDPVALARLAEVVGWALDDGLYVMVNVHHDSWQWINRMPADHDAVLAEYTAIWTQVATAFRDASPRLLFESVNEPQFVTEKAALLAELNTAFHTVVRGSGGRNATRLLVMPTMHTNAGQAYLDELASTFTALGDPNLIATVHYYGYWPFSVNIAGGYRFDAAARQDLLDTFQRVHDTFVAKGIPVIIGEYGLLGFDRSTGTIEQGEKLKFFEFFGHQARISRVTTMLWDNGQHFDRTALTWRDPELYEQMRSSWRTRSGTASSDVVFTAATGPITAKTVTLNLNGTSFSGLRLGRTTLRRGVDYSLAGDQLTLSTGLLRRLLGDRAYGVRSTLSVRFSHGVPWRLDILSYDTATLSGATGTVDAFTLPAAFHGDRLATMTAVYADGSYAGPQNWTAYKEYDATFHPDYAAGTIGLTPAFFAEVTDGAPVTLTFIFWSGATVTYHVTRTGTTVTGTAD
ncbi:cellulase family glycosylhydrolase [Actinoplanes oblitus]|uniref:Cellulase family glycosylhydrolase n=1 Tax=Actinoplanes oblitus TaxID=3040509 RepID=A0ABY8WK76_9ACTN|nr:cellulase family glycosylhydrolase [Actinoplanes oblitus]WIM97503.1 cellulase family glycosylhydrolase [Actinoplanes oblitus]